MNQQANLSKNLGYNTPYPIYFSPYEHYPMPFWGYPMSYHYEPSPEQQIINNHKIKIGHSDHNNVSVTVKQEEPEIQDIGARQTTKKHKTQQLLFNQNFMQRNQNTFDKQFKNNSQLKILTVKIEQNLQAPQNSPQGQGHSGLPEMISKLFQSYAIDHHNMRTNFKAQETFIDMLDQKIKSFKKSKEQMIKIIIRRAQKYYKTIHRCKRDQRFIKYGGFKSMNTVYLQTMFSDPMFVESFEHVALNFKQQFKAENQRKIETIYELMMNQKVIENKELYIQIISEKNKMPWSRYWVNKMMKNIDWIYSTFCKDHIKESVLRKLTKQ